MTSGSVSFDRAAGYYDKTRSIDPAVWKRVVEVLTNELRGRGLVLEAGVGTGRAALPVREADIPVVGIDISEAMMAKLREKTGGTPPFPLAAADAGTLPFPDQTFGAAYLIHVLHLIPGWRDVLGEIARVIRRPGVVLVDIGSISQRGMASRVTKRFAREAGSSLSELMPAWFRPEELDAEMARLGGTLRLLPEMSITRARPIRAGIEEMAAGIHAFTWALDDESRRRAGARTLAWAEQEFGSLDTVRRMRWRIAWRAYDLE